MPNENCSDSKSANWRDTAGAAGLGAGRASGASALTAGVSLRRDPPPLFLGRLGAQRGRVDAEALAARAGPVVEDVAQVAAAARARDLDAPHAVRAVGLGGDGVLGRRRREAGPAGARVVLRVGREQLGAAARAQVRRLVVRVPVRARERGLGALLPQHAKLVG